MPTIFIILISNIGNILLYFKCEIFKLSDKLVQIIKELIMLDSQKLNEISNKIKEVVSSSPLGDVEKNLNALLKGMFTKMELVTREEFEVQAEVLRNTRQKLELLEARLAELESSASLTQPEA